MNDKRDMAPLVWGYIKSRETARRMSAYAGEVTGMHPQFSHSSSARALDMDLAVTKAYAGKNHISAGIQHGELLRLRFLFDPALLTRLCRFLDTTPGARKAAICLHP